MPTTNTTRLSRLDGLRGLAASGVMLHHIFFFFAPLQFAMVLLTPLAHWIQTLGWTLVDLFFILSGYVFAHVYLRDGSLQTSEGRASFWVARFARLWPLHLVMLLVIAIADPHDKANTLLAFAAHLAMLQAFVHPVAGTYDWSSWSLTVEVFCYAIFVVASSCGRRTLLWITGALIVVSLLGFIEVHHAGGPFAGSVFRRGLLGFFIGQALWHARDRLATIRTPLLVAGVVAGLCLDTGSYSHVLPLSLLAWPCLLLLSLRLKAMEARPMVWLGDRSYAIYLINLPLTLGVIDLCNGRHLSTPQTMFVQAAIVATVLLAADLSYRWIESPSRRKIRDLWAKRANGAANAGGLPTKLA